MIVTIDGPVGTGKSTIAKRLADELGFVYFDTGGMYRCFTYGVIKHKIDMDDNEQLQQFLNTFDLNIKDDHGTKHYFFEEEEITEKIRGEEVTSQVSRVSSYGPVREKLVNIQQKLGHGVDAVFEGRDMGTIVFPDADVKIFLTADPRVRAQRRYDELCEKLPEEAAAVTVDQVLESVNKRDTFDSTRKLSPLRQAEDAHLVDSSNLSIDEVVTAILELARE